MHNEYSGHELAHHAQKAILRIRDVRSCRVVTDGSGAVSEIFVVATGADRQPKMIARDVVALLKVEFDLDVDYRKIGVVLMEGESGSQAAPPAHEPGAAEETAPGEPREAPTASKGDLAGPPWAAGSQDTPDPPWAAGPQEATGAAPRTAPAPESMPSFHGGEEGLEILEDYTRTSYRGLKVTLDRDSATAEVTLARDDLEVTGCSDGERGVPLRSVIARAALRALAELLDENFRLCLSEIREIELAGRKALVAVVDVAGGRETGSFSGCALAGADPNEAAVLAVLDALNRPTGRWKPRREIHYRIR